MSGEINKGIIMHGGTINADAIGVGDQATAISNAGHQAASHLDLPKLAEELQQLRKALRQEATEVGHDAAVVAVGEAEQAAREGNAQGALDHLKKAGKWAFDVATKVGISIASDAIKTALKG